MNWSILIMASLRGEQLTEHVSCVCIGETAAASRAADARGEANSVRDERHRRQRGCETRVPSTDESA